MHFINISKRGRDFSGDRAFVKNVRCYARCTTLGLSAVALHDGLFRARYARKDYENRSVALNNRLNLVDIHSREMADAAEFAYENSENSVNSETRIDFRRSRAICTSVDLAGADG